MDPLARHAQAHPEAVALVGEEGEWTYGDLHRAVTRRAAAFREQGIGEGGRVALYAEREAETVALLWALWRIGAVAVPMSTREPAAEVVRRGEQVGAELFVTRESPVTEAAAGRIRTCAPVELEGEKETLLTTDSLPPERPATIVYTSGSTGTPKAALHTWRNHLYSAKGSNANIPLRRGDRWLLSLPLYHVGGLAILIRCAIAGAGVVLPSADRSLAATLDAGSVTHVSLVATQVRRVLADWEGRPPSALRAVLLGGGPIPDELLRRGTEAGWPLHTSYGCTEMASQVTTTPPGASLDTLRTAGRRLPHRRVRIRDGQILVAGAPLFRGYVTDTGIDDPRTEDGWYPTGDRGRIEADGRLRVEGRMDRMFVSGGENIQPEEIESVLERQDGVEQAVVVPVPDPEYGRRPVAFVRKTDDISGEAVRAALAGQLPSFKIPDAFYSLPEEALADGLKVDRERLRQRARTLRETEGSTSADEEE